MSTWAADCRLRETRMRILLFCFTSFLVLMKVITIYNDNSGKHECKTQSQKTCRSQWIRLEGHKIHVVVCTLKLDQTGVARQPQVQPKIRYRLSARVYCKEPRYSPMLQLVQHLCLYSAQIWLSTPYRCKKICIARTVKTRTLDRVIQM